LPSCIYLFIVHGQKGLGKGCTGSQCCERGLETGKKVLQGKTVQKKEAGPKETKSKNWKKAE